MRRKEKLAEDKITEADRTITQYTSWKKSHQANLTELRITRTCCDGRNRLRQLETVRVPKRDPY